MLSREEADASSCSPGLTSKMDLGVFRGHFSAKSDSDEGLSKDQFLGAESDLEISHHITLIFRVPTFCAAGKPLFLA